MDSDQSHDISYFPGFHNTSRSPKDEDSDSGHKLSPSRTSPTSSTGDRRGSLLYSEASSPEYQFLVSPYDPGPTFTHQDMDSTDDLLAGMFLIYFLELLLPLISPTRSEFFEASACPHKPPG